MTELPPIPSPGHCPTCQQEVQLDNGQLPERCPFCHRVWRPADAGFLSCIAASLRQYFKLSGRATRSEFWWYRLFDWGASTILGFVVQIIAGIIATAAVNSHISDRLSPAAIGIGTVILLIVYLLIMLALFIPCLTVTVRRLHDTGASGWWLPLSLITLYGGAMLICFASYPLKHSHGYEGYSTGLIYPILLCCGIVSLLIGIGTTIYIIVRMFFDSQRGPNKYGPSAKYPLG